MIFHIINFCAEMAHGNENILFVRYDGKNCYYIVAQFIMECSVLSFAVFRFSRNLNICTMMYIENNQIFQPLFDPGRI